MVCERRPLETSLIEKNVQAAGCVVVQWADLVTFVSDQVMTLC